MTRNKGMRGDLLETKVKGHLPVSFLRQMILKPDVEVCILWS